MNTIINDRYLSAHLASFITIQSAVHLTRTSRRWQAIIFEHLPYNIILGCKTISIHKSEPICDLSKICKTGDLASFHWFIISYPDYKYNKNMAFLESTLSGKCDLVDHLIQLGADINTLDGKALANSVRKGDIDMVRYLVNKGANIHANIGITVSESCNIYGHYFLSRVTNGILLLLLALCHNHPKIVALLMEKGCCIHPDYLDKLCPTIIEKYKNILDSK
jgi:hypothetical protein